METKSQVRDQPPERESVSLGDSAISDMWKIEAIVEVWKRKDFCTKQEP